MSNKSGSAIGMLNTTFREFYKNYALIHCAIYSKLLPGPILIIIVLIIIIINAGITEKVSIASETSTLLKFNLKDI